MSIGVPVADAIAMVEANGSPPSLDPAAAAPAVPGGARRFGSAYNARTARRWSEFMVAAALRAAGDAAAQRT